jgi:hypothetical protein
MFFFEKKNQKTFAIWGVACGGRFGWCGGCEFGSE